MNERQRRFADCYIKCGSASQAARDAGYSAATAGAIGSRLLKNVEVRALIASRMETMEAQRLADADEVMAFLSSVMRGEVKDQFGLDASLADRIKAAQELMKRHSVTDRQQVSLSKVDELLAQFRKAINDDREDEENE